MYGSQVGDYCERVSKTGKECDGFAWEVIAILERSESIAKVEQKRDNLSIESCDSFTTTLAYCR